MSRVIRGGVDARHVVPAEVIHARDEAGQLLHEARAEAERRVAQARAEAEGIRAHAEAEGRTAAQAEAAGLLADASAARDRILADAHDQIARLAIAVARRIVGDRLEADPTTTGHLVQRALDRARRARRLTLRVHPADVDTVRPLVGDGDRSVTVAPDPELARGDCVLHTDVGEVDARLEVQLAALERALRQPGG
jgi:type III secretion protein L